MRNVCVVSAEPVALRERRPETCQSALICRCQLYNGTGEIHLPGLSDLLDTSSGRYTPLAFRVVRRYVKETDLRSRRNRRKLSHD